MSSNETETKTETGTIDTQEEAPAQPIAPAEDTKLSTQLEARNVDNSTWNTLKNSIFPGAKAASVLMAVDYCIARRLDVLKKPVHIVPMQVTMAGQKDARGYDVKVWRDVIMPGIAETRITAMRTGNYVGQDEPVWGPTVDYRGLQVPEWCKITVYRLVAGQRCPWTATVRYEEAVGLNKEGHPNAMWAKRKYGQLDKCTEAAALRKAFPEELGGIITAEEMHTGEPTPVDEPPPAGEAPKSRSSAAAEALRAREAGRTREAEWADMDPKKDSNIPKEETKSTGPAARTEEKRPAYTIDTAVAALRGGSTVEALKTTYEMIRQTFAGSKDGTPIEIEAFYRDRKEHLEGK